MRRLKQRCCNFMILVFMCLATGCAKEEESVGLEEAELSQETRKEETTQQPEEEKEEIYVYVCGAVHVPGVYKLPADSRVFEAVESAGGLLETAAADQLNQAETVSDGQQIYVPDIEEANTGTSGTDRAEKDERVDLNTAGKEELMTLAGIGEVRAEAILRYREEHGRFESVEELKQIEGIKEGIFNRIKDKVRVS